MSERLREWEANFKEERKGRRGAGLAACLALRAGPQLVTVRRTSGGRAERRLYTPAGR